MAGHASFRLLQFLSAPNVLHDLHGLEDAIGDHTIAGADAHVGIVGFDRAHRQLFLIALERGFLDTILDRSGGPDRQQDRARVMGSDNSLEA